MAKPVAVGGDIFAGLFTLGVKQAGFNVAHQLEHCDYGEATCRLNFPRLDIRVGKDNWDLRTLPKKPDLFYTNPPCAPWSNWNSSSTSWRTDPRIRWVDDLIDAAIEIKAKTFIWESVPSTWNKGRPFVADKTRKFIEAGYHVTVLLQNNMYLGAPQNRKRMMLIGHRFPLDWPKLVEPMTMDEWLDLAAELKYEKLAQDLPETKTTAWERRLWRSARQFNGSLRTAAYAMQQNKKSLEIGAGTGRPIPSFMMRRMPGDEPPNLVTGHRWHPHEPRRLTYAELLILCGMPPTWKTACRTRGGDNGDAAGELLRAVLPPVGKWVATAVKRGLKKPRLNSRKPIARVYDCRKPDGILEDEFDFDTYGPLELPEPTDREEKRRTRKAREAKQTKSRTPHVPGTRGANGEWKTSKDFIIHRCREDKYLNGERPPKEWAEAVAAEVRGIFPGRTTKASDVYWVWRRMEENAA